LRQRARCIAHALGRTSRACSSDVPDLSLGTLKVKPASLLRLTPSETMSFSSHL
jgi:hypothetical protein